MILLETTRKIDLDDVLLLKEIQMRLLRKGMRFSQKDLFSFIVKFVTDRETQFVNFVTGKSRMQADDPFDAWMRTEVKGGPRTNAVKEHDLVF